MYPKFGGPGITGEIKLKFILPILQMHIVTFLTDVLLPGKDIVTFLTDYSAGKRDRGKKLVLLPGKDIVTFLTNVLFATCTAHRRGGG